MVIWSATIYFSRTVIAKKSNYLLIFVLIEHIGHCTSVLCKMWPEAEEIFEYQAYCMI